MDTLRAMLIMLPQMISDPVAEYTLKNPPVPTLYIRRIGYGPRGLPALSLIHYGDERKREYRNPEMRFELHIAFGIVRTFRPYYFANEYANCEEWSVIPNGDNPRIDNTLPIKHRNFAAQWDRTFASHRYLEALKRQR